MSKTKDKTTVSDATNHETQVKWWVCEKCKFKNDLHLRFCGQCGTQKPVTAEPGKELLKLDFGGGANPMPGFKCVDVHQFGEVDFVMSVAERIWEWKQDGQVLTNARIGTKSGSFGALSGDDSEPLYEPMYSKFHAGYKPWPFEDNSVDEANCQHLMEHLESRDRVWFYNELWRVLKSGAKCTFVSPSWTSGRAYGDYTHLWPPVSVFGFYYLSDLWRVGGEMPKGQKSPTPDGKMPKNAPHVDKAHDPWGYDCNFHVDVGMALHEAMQAKDENYRQFATTHFIEAVQDIQWTVTKLERAKRDENGQVVQE